MDQIYLPYTPSNGVPQESKLATYMVKPTHYTNLLFIILIYLNLESTEYKYTIMHK